MQSTKLMKLSYFDPKSEIRLECYADTVVIEPEGKFQYIAAIRLGGYPEPVKGISEAIFGGGTVTCEIHGEEKTLSARVKQYYKELSHDGIYAESVLQIKDEEHRAADNSREDGDAETSGNTNNEPSAAAPRKCYIFCAQGDDEQLFEEIDEKISVPLIPEFREYVLSEFRRRGILKQLNMVTTHEKFDVWVLNMEAEEKNVIVAINDGLRSGAISIPGASETKFPIVRGVTEYLNKFGVQIAKRIKEQFNPLFDPSTEKPSPEVMAVNAFVNENTSYNLYNAQLAVVEAHKRCLEIKKGTLCIGECGTGKSKIGTSALHAFQQRQQFRNGDSDTHKKCFNIILCPSHIAKKWIREIEETLPNTFATIVTSITELNEVYEAYQRDDHTCYVIITKEKARDGYMSRPAAVWNKRRKRFICPDCYGDFVRIAMEIWKWNFRIAEANIKYP